MRIPKIINPRGIMPHPFMKVIMRKDFYDECGEQLKRIEKDTGAMYIGHNIIKNYQEGGHSVSTFCNYEEWHDVYWDKYCYEDPAERTIHKATKANDFGVISWEMGYEGSPCIQERTLMTNVKDGLFFSFKRPDNYLESLLIGWKDLTPETLDTDYIAHLTSLLKPLRDYHWDVHSNI